MSDVYVRDGRVERSIPVQSRVDFVTLAELVLYFEQQGVVIRSMSQLVSWSLDTMIEAFVRADIIQRQIPNGNTALEVLRDRNLFQRSMAKRSLKKIHNAIAFENLRNEGVEPKSYAPLMHKTIHNTHSVNPLDTERPANYVRDEDVMFARKNFEQQLRLRQMRESIHTEPPEDEDCDLCRTDPNESDEQARQRIAAKDKAFIDAMDGARPTIVNK